MSTAADFVSVALTSIVLVLDINVGIRKHPQNTRQTYRKRKNDMNQGQNAWNNWLAG